MDSRRAQRGGAVVGGNGKVDAENLVSGESTAGVMSMADEESKIYVEKKVYKDGSGENEGWIIEAKLGVAIGIPTSGLSLAAWALAWKQL